MRPAYDISYRNEIVETQGRLFGRLARENPDCDGEDFITSYMKSELRSRIDRAEARPANMTAAELKENFVRNDGYSFKPGEPVDGLSADWIGQFYAYAQWQWGIPSGEIVDRIPIGTMRIVYPGLHDLDLPLAVERAEKWQTRGGADGDEKVWKAAGAGAEKVER